MKLALVAIPLSYCWHTNLLISLHRIIILWDLQKKERSVCKWNTIVQNPWCTCKLSSLSLGEGAGNYASSSVICSVTMHVCMYIWSAVLIHTKKVIVQAMKRCKSTVIMQWWISQVYKNLCLSYTLVFLKRSYYCLFCPLRAGQKAKKAEVVSKCH